MVAIDWETVDPEVKKVFDTYTKEKTFPKHALILDAGSICNHLLIIKSGLVRNFYFDPKGNDITHWFSGPNSVVTSPPSFFKQEPSFFRIETLQPTVANVITHSQLEEAFKKSIELERFGRQLAINIMMALGQKVIDLQTKTAEERYHELLFQYPDILQQAKLGHIAGYLGITQQSLSRIRGNKKV